MWLGMKADGQTGFLPALLPNRRLSAAFVQPQFARPFGKVAFKLIAHYLH